MRLKIIFLVFLILLNSCSNQISDIKINVLKEKYILANIKSNQRDKLEVHFLNVGKGDCILIISPQKETILIDTGNMFTGGKIVKYLKNLKINRINYLFITHPHLDHIGGINSILQNITIDKYYIPNTKYYNDNFNKIQSIIKGKKVLMTDFNINTINYLDNEVYFEILSPIREDYLNLNDSSLVIKLTYKENSFLFMGDITNEAQKDLIKNGSKLKADIYKVPHHGNEDAYNEMLLNEVSPKYSVIQTSKKYPYKNVLEKIKEKNIQTFVTSNDGNIKIESDGKNLKHISDDDIENNENDSFINIED